MTKSEINPESTMPWVLRLAGLWLIWCAWASTSGWILSGLKLLSPLGYLAVTPFLLVAGYLWWKRCGAIPRRTGKRWSFMRKGRLRYLVLGFQVTALLTLLGAILHTPWSFDAVTYRLPRILYWLANQGWYWIGTIDGRLDYSGCGLEWQSLPVMVLTRSDRVLFLLSFLPYLMVPGLTYLAARTMGLRRHPSLVLMWLLPSAYCIGLQSGGLQNDGYSVAFSLACIAFAGRALRNKDGIACLLSFLAACLLTGAKISNLPLMLPLGILVVSAALRSGMLKWRWSPALILGAGVSFLPLAVLAFLHTGDWTGDPHDQWGFRTKNPVAAVAANLILWGNDILQPPVVVGASKLNQATAALNGAAKPFWNWLAESHRMFTGVAFGDLVYEGSAGPGFSIGLFLAVALSCGLFMKRHASFVGRGLPWPVKLSLAATWIAWLVLLSKLGTDHSARNAAPYYPLLLFGFSRLRPVSNFLESRRAFPVALLCSLTILPIIILTPARPLVPIGVLQKISQNTPLESAISSVAKKYHVWAEMRDDMKPIRDHLPKSVPVIGYAGGFRDTGYGLWKPLGSRTIEEIGITNSRTIRHPQIPEYVVATRRGIETRYKIPFDEWCGIHHATVDFSYSKSLNLDADTAENLEIWYLLKTKHPSAP